MNVTFQVKSSSVIKLDRGNYLSTKHPLGVLFLLLGRCVVRRCCVVLVLKINHQVYHFHRDIDVEDGQRAGFPGSVHRFT